jgi:hypothetical protein
MGRRRMVFGADVEPGLFGSSGGQGVRRFRRHRKLTTSTVTHGAEREMSAKEAKRNRPTLKHYRRFCNTTPDCRTPPRVFGKSDWPSRCRSRFAPVGLRVAPGQTGRTGGTSGRHRRKAQTEGTSGRHRRKAQTEGTDGRHRRKAQTEGTDGRHRRKAQTEDLWRKASGGRTCTERPSWMARSD